MAKLALHALLYPEAGIPNQHAETGLEGCDATASVIWRYVVN